MVSPDTTGASASAYVSPVWVVRDARDKRFTHAHKSVLFALASRLSDDRPEAYPTQDTLAGDTGMGVTKLKRTIAELVAWGYLSVRVAKIPTGRRNYYAPNLVELGSVARVPDPSVADGEGSAGRAADGSVGREARKDPSKAQVPEECVRTRVARKPVEETLSLFYLRCAWADEPDVLPMKLAEEMRRLADGGTDAIMVPAMRVASAA